MGPQSTALKLKQAQTSLPSGDGGSNLLHMNMFKTSNSPFQSAPKLFVLASIVSAFEWKLFEAHDYPNSSAMPPALSNKVS